MFGHKNHKYAGEVEIIQEGKKPLVMGVKQCCHCGNHWAPQPGSGRRRGFCFNCQGDICSEACAKECIPFEAQVEAIEKGIIIGEAFKGTPLISARGKINGV